MNYDKPHVFLFKGDPTPTQIKVSTYVNLRGTERLLPASIVSNSSTRTTTITYGLGSQTGVDHLEHDEQIISWDGRSWNVVVIIGTGSGGTGGQATVSSDDFL